jgi:hypothetical protein
VFERVDDGPARRRTQRKRRALTRYRLPRSSGTKRSAVLHARTVSISKSYKDPCIGTRRCLHSKSHHVFTLQQILRGRGPQGVGGSAPLTALHRTQALQGHRVRAPLSHRSTGFIAPYAARSRPASTATNLPRPQGHRSSSSTRGKFSNLPIQKRASSFLDLLLAALTTLLSMAVLMGMRRKARCGRSSSTKTGSCGTSSPAHVPDPAHRKGPAFRRTWRRELPHRSRPSCRLSFRRSAEVIDHD